MNEEQSDVLDPQPTGEAVDDQSTQAPSAATGKDKLTLAWLIALLPLILLPIDYFAPHLSDAHWFWWTVVWMSVALVLSDIKELGERGVVMSRAWALLTPAFLIARTIKAKSPAVVPITWFVGVGISLAVSMTVPVYEFVGADLEPAIEDWFHDGGAPGTTVECPNRQDVFEGDTVWCKARHPDGTEVRVKVTIEKDGMQSWIVTS